MNDTGTESPDSLLVVSADRLTVRLNCLMPGEDCVDDLLDQIEQELAHLTIADAPGRDEIRELIETVPKDQAEIRDLVIVTGLPPVPPKEGRIEWAGDFFSEGFRMDEETGTVDYRMPLAQPSVAEGQLLARVIPPIDGKDGMDVFGKRIRVEKPQRLRMRVGANVRVDEKERTTYAAKDGRVRWAGGVLSVDDVYMIQGNVGLETGNVYHPGALRIGKDIEEGSQVRADGDTEVGGVVERADVTVGGSLVVRGGITGRGQQYIRVGGGLGVRFIIEAELEVGEDVAVRTEVVQSKLRTRGRLIMPNGRLVGGTTEALRGVEVRQAGSDAMVRTVIVAGQDHRLAGEVEAREKEIKQLERRKDKIVASLTPLLGMRQRMSANKTDTVARLKEQQSELEEAIATLQKEVRNLREDSAARAKPEIVIMGDLYPETVLCLQGMALRIKDHLKGPLRAVARGEKIVLLAL